jgi:hypothetical protein
MQLTIHVAERHIVGGAETMQSGVVVKGLFFGRDRAWAMSRVW